MAALKLWLVSQDANDGYDTFDSAVVVAATEADARLIHPSGTQHWHEGRGWVYDSSGHDGTGYGWTPPADVKAELVGDAAPSLAEGSVVCASFNAG